MAEYFVLSYKRVPLIITACLTLTAIAHMRIAFGMYEENRLIREALNKGDIDLYENLLNQRTKK